jgi:multidrug efflux system outer membrane protein
MPGWRQRARRLLPVLLAALLLQGCLVGPRYKRPAVPAPPNFRDLPGPAEAESIADLPWWEVFQDETLRGLIRESIVHNYDMRVAAARIEEARAQAGIARSFLYPQVAAAGSVSGGKASRLSDPPQVVDDRAFHNFNAGFTLSWELDVFGRIRREKEAATARFVATQEERRGVLITLVGDVAATYFQLRELDLEMEITRRTLESNDETVAFYRHRVEGGVSNQLELDQAIANRSRTAALIPDLERRIAITENALSLLLGRSPGAIPRGVALTAQHTPPRIPAGMPASLLERRPDVARAEQLLVASNADVGAAKALFFPSISLTGFLGSMTKDLRNLADPGASIWALSGGFVQPIFQGGRIKHNYEAAKARFDQSMAVYEKSAQNGYREVSDSLVSIDKFEKVRAEQEVGVEALQDASRLSRLRYETGLANYLEILIADQQLLDQELLLARTRGDQLRAFVDLYRALGGGWQPETPAAPPPKPKGP